ncbi:hypothetical protein [Actinomadura sp. 3N508]
MNLEQEAAFIRTYQLQSVSGLLQAMERLCVDSATPERTIELLSDILRHL